MIKRSISNPDLFKVIDVRARKTYYGCNQEWYTTEWQRRSGCGPSVASNIILYLSNAQAKPGFIKNCSSKEKCVVVMQEMWDSVTPTLAGIPTTRMLYEAVIDYTKAHGLTVEYHVFDVPDKVLLRPSLPEAITFIEAALAKDVPVAFLNLCNGDEKKLSSWHWVTIIALDYAEGGADAFVTILDEGMIAKINLALWYNTTTMGGGFVYFTSTATAKG
ncbi:MAG: hypothetical protein AB9917_13305 [Negativicutes bacterium]